MEVGAGKYSGRRGSRKGEAEGGRGRGRGGGWWVVATDSIANDGDDAHCND